MAYVCGCDSGGTDQVAECSATSGLAICTEITASTEQILAINENLTSVSIGYVFAWGMAAVLMFYFIGFGVGQIKKLLNYT